MQPLRFANLSSGPPGMRELELYDKSASASQFNGALNSGGAKDDTELYRDVTFPIACCDHIIQLPLNWAVH